MPNDDPVQRALRNLAAHVKTQPDHDLWPAVRERIAADPAPATTRRGRLSAAWKPLLVAACLLLVAALSLVSPVRDAAASVLELVGIDIRQAESGARPPAPSPPANGELGRQIPVDAVTAEAGFTVPEPRLAALGDPDKAYLLDGGDHQIVTLVWRRRDGIPVASASGASALLSVFHGGPTQPEFLQKILFAGSRARQVTVHGQLGVFVAGPQAVIYQSSNREIEEAQSRLSANSLIWQQDGLTFRLESELGRKGSLAIARSVS